MPLLSDTEVCNRAPRPVARAEPHCGTTARESLCARRAGSIDRRSQPTWPEILPEILPRPRELASTPPTTAQKIAEITTIVNNSTIEPIA